MAVPSESVKRYIFVKGGPDKPLNKLVKFKNGVGVRAVAMAGAHSDFSHFLAIEGTSLQQVIALSKALPVAQNQTMSLMSCTTPDCTGFLDGILHTLHTPSYMPPFEFCAFAYVELHVGWANPGSQLSSSRARGKRPSQSRVETVCSSRSARRLRRRSEPISRKSMR